MNAEFNPGPTEAAFRACGLTIGRCFGSKSAYRDALPNAKPVFNANVFTHDGKVWWGDLDLKRDKPALKRVAARLRTRLYVLAELDGRFENAERSLVQVMNRAVWHTGLPLR